MFGTIALHTVRLACLAALPFVLLVRGALYLYQGRGWHPWPALLAASLLYAAPTIRRVPSAESATLDPN